MFDFFKKHNQPLFEGLCDFHNHLLPGVDDGSKDVTMSVNMLKAYQKLGFSTVIPSPHIYQELFPNTPETIQKAFQKLTEANYSDKFPTINSYIAEYMVDESFINKLENKIPNLLIYKKYILLEIHFFGNIQLLEEACFELSHKGIIPILAHPERYYYLKTISQFKALKQKGFYLQLNALSLLGHYGLEVKEKAQLILKSGLYDFLATDAHNKENLDKLNSLKLSKKQGIKWEAIREFQLDIFR